MPIQNMQGPYLFTRGNVDYHISKTHAGNYVLGIRNKNGNFDVRYVGRSDTDVNDRIKDHLQEGYTYFMFCYASSPKDAFETECRQYHAFGGNTRLDNDVHPDRPSNSKNWKCPVCG